MSANDDALLVTTYLTQEDTSLLAWVAHHRLIGATKIHVFMHPRFARTQILVGALRAAGLIDASVLNMDAGSIAKSGSEAASRLENRQPGGMGVFLMPDEYIAIKTRHRTLQAMIKAIGATTVSIPTRVFGSMGRVSHDRAIRPLTLTQRAKDPQRTADTPLQHRTLSLIGLFANRTEDRPIRPLVAPAKINWVNGNGTMMPQPHAVHFWRKDPAAHGVDKVQINKYPFASVETTLLAAFQGGNPHVEADVIETWQGHRASEVEDKSLVKAGKAAEKEITTYLQTPEIAEAYDKLHKTELDLLTELAASNEMYQKLRTALGGPIPGRSQTLISPSDDTSVEHDEAPQPDKADTPKPAAKAKSKAPAKTKSKTRSKPVAVKTVPQPQSAEDDEDTATDVEEATAKDPDRDPFDRVDTDPPADWYSEIYPGGESEGFFRKLASHSVVLIERDPKTLVVTFDNLSNVNDLSYGRAPWAYKFLRDKGHSHLGIMARRKDWYRDPQLIDYLRTLRDDGLFRRFDRVVMAGTSMGGFAAMTFSSLAPGATVLALSPQSTLDEQTVPWEERFGMGRSRNWTLPMSDAAFEIQDAAQVYLILDPYFEPDLKHAERMQGPNVTRLSAWFSGHFSPVFLRRADILKQVMDHAIAGTLTPAVFYSLYRARKTLPWYERALREMAEERGHTALAARVQPAFRQLRAARQNAQSEDPAA